MASEIKSFTVDELRLLVEGELLKVFEAPGSTPKLSDIARYGVFPGGKRIRPVLALAWCVDLGGDPSKLALAAAALELVHCASLIHDDLPALDNDDFRRGRPACHRAFTEAGAILAGDMLVSRAHRCLLDAPFPSDTLVEFTRVLANAYIDLCLGQHLDLLPVGERGDLPAIHRLKTGALFSACTAFGSLGAGRGGNEIRRAAELGHAIGLLFQISDDFIDAHGTDAARGRPGSSDERNGKENFFSDSRLDPLKIVAETEREIERHIHELSPRGASLTGELVSRVVRPMKNASV